MSKAVHVFARFRVKADKIDMATSVMNEIRTDSLAQEEGCVSYTFLRSTTDPALFSSSEIWSDSESEAAHWQTAHLNASLAKITEFLDGEPEVSKFYRH